MSMEAFFSSSWSQLALHHNASGTNHSLYYPNGTERVPGLPLVSLAMANAIHGGRPSEARWISLQHVTQHPHDRSYLAQIYQEITNAYFDSSSKTSSTTTTTNDFSSDPPHGLLLSTFLNHVALADFDNMPRPMAKYDAADCLPVTWDKDWDMFCSILPRSSQQRHETDHGCPVHTSWSSTSALWPDTSGFNNHPHRLSCCEFFHGSSSYTKLPVLHEPAVRMRMRIDTKNNANTGYESSSTIINLDLEQEGYLRPFDVSTVLWPSAYFLTLCVTDPSRCGAPEIVMAMDSIHTDEGSHKNDNQNDCRGTDYGPVAVELGTGIGAPSIVLTLILQQKREYHNAKRAQAKCTPVEDENGVATSSSPPLLVATDVAPQSLAITLANARFNGATALAVASLNFTNIQEVQAFRTQYFAATKSSTNPTDTADDLSTTTVVASTIASTTTTSTTSVTRNGFTILLGSSLQALFHDSAMRETKMLWNVLDELLDTDNPHAVAILAHTIDDPIDDPPVDSDFVLSRRVSGDVFDMTTRSGDTSEFVLSIFQRRRR
jgi:hypothetical protein